MRFQFWPLLLLLAACASHGPQQAGSDGGPLSPVTHADFRHDTLALSWQPGFCSTESGCLPDQPKEPLIGLHGLWASEPHTLEQKGVPVQDWWRKGCDLFDDAGRPSAPPLDAAMSATLAEIVPHTRQPLAPHEWNKHARCFGYTPGPFFAKGVDLRQKFARSPVGEWMSNRQGTVIAHADLLSFFDQATGNTQAHALQLRCGYDHQGRVVLTELWMTLRPEQLDAFPQAASFMMAVDAQDNCPTRFLLPRW